jgi:hypothetical protein
MMAGPRANISPEKQARKAKARDLIRAAGGIEAAAEVTRVGKTLLSEYGRPDNETYMPDDVRADLEDITFGKPEHPHLTRYDARRLGFALVPMPKGELPVGQSLLQALSESIHDAGELHKNICDAIGDGKIDRAERAVGMALAQEAAEAAMRIHSFLEQLTELA